jgi:small subunit ribosomal protein S16
MLIIRLQRAGKANRPEFRIVLAEKTAAAEKKFVEVLGNYNPRTKEFGVKEERLKYWISQHVALSPTVHNLFVTKNILQGAKVKAFSVPAKPTEPEAAQPQTEVEGSDQTTEPAPEAESPKA